MSIPTQPATPSDASHGDLLGALDGDPQVDAALGDEALVRAMLDVEAALARAAASSGLVSHRAAEEVARTADALVLDPGDLGRRATASGNPVVPLVAILEDAVPEASRSAVHLGATSQDILDTALAILVSRALEPLRAHLGRAADAAAGLAAANRDTLMLARTLGQPAAPTTFGLRAAGWLTGLDSAEAELVRTQDSALAVQLGGAAGTRAGYGSAGAQVAAALAASLGLADPGRPWHTERSRLHSLAVVLHGVVTAGAKVAADVIQMSQAEIGEAAEGTPGGSSAMPHKRNPVGSVLILGAARRAPALAGSLLAAGVHEQERATGSWHAEWQPLRDLVRLAGGVAARTAVVLANLRVDPAAMRRNLDAACPAALSEALVGLLRSALGRTHAQDAVRRALDEAEPVAALRADPRVAEAVSAGLLNGEDLAGAIDPAKHTGDAGPLVDAALAEHESGDHVNHH